MSKNKCCGNCKNFKDEDVNGEGFCEVKYEFEGCYHECDNHEFKNNGWIEITPDNIDEVNCIPKDKVVIGWIRNKEFNSCFLSHFWFTLKSIAMQGGFYYYVLPELKIE